VPWHLPENDQWLNRCLLNKVEGVYIINGFGGAGMTLSFGFAEEVVELSPENILRNFTYRNVSFKKN
jgi:hypothetical protein